MQLGSSLDIRSLKIVVTLAEELHFRRAAAKLYVSQPALTASLKNLEHNLGVQLFHRNSRSVELTEAGRVFSAEAKCILAQADRLLTLMKESADQNERGFRIGYCPSMNVPWICSVVARARTQLGIPVDLVGAESASVPQMLLDGELDAAFILGVSHYRHKLLSETILREPLVLALAASDALADRPALSLNQLQGKPLIWLAQDMHPKAHSDFLALFARSDYRPQVVQEAYSFDECLEFVGASTAITFVPLSVRQRCCRPEITFRNIGTASLQIHSSLIYPSESRSSELEKVLEIVRQSGQS